jgi:hypothetical protein
LSANPEIAEVPGAQRLDKAGEVIDLDKFSHWG